MNKIKELTKNWFFIKRADLSEKREVKEVLAAIDFDTESAATAAEVVTMAYDQGYGKGYSKGFSSGTFFGVIITSLFVALVASTKTEQEEESVVENHYHIKLEKQPETESASLGGAA